MTTLKLTTRDLSSGRIQVTDGQGTSGSYPRDFHERGQAHRYAARQFLAEQKGWPDAKVNIVGTTHDEDGVILTATRLDGTTARRRKPVHAIRNVERYLQRRQEMPGLDPEDIHGVGAREGGDILALTVSDLRALLDYIREA